MTSIAPQDLVTPLFFGTLTPRGKIRVSQRQASWGFGWTTFGGKDYEYQWVLVSQSAGVGNFSEGMYWGKDDEGSGHGAYKMVSDERWKKVRGCNNNNSDLYLPTTQISVGSDVSQTTSPVPTAYRHLVRMILVMLWKTSDTSTSPHIRAKPTYLSALRWDTCQIA